MNLYPRPWPLLVLEGQPPPSPRSTKYLNRGKAHIRPITATSSHHLAVPRPHHCFQTQYRGQAEEGEESHSQVPPVILVAILYNSKQGEAQDSKDVHQDKEEGDHRGHGVDCLPHSNDERLQGRDVGLGKGARLGGFRGQRPSLLQFTTVPASGSLPGTW